MSEFNGQPVIRMREVSAGAMNDPAATVVRGVNWSVAAGDFWVVAGHQGAGKSNFLMMTAGLMLPTEGEYELFGEPLAAFEADRLQQRLRVGFVFDGGHLFNRLTVAENVALPLRYHRKMPEPELAARVAQLLEATELTSIADNLAGTMGWRWQKRIGLALALALEPELLLLDNPLGGVDARQAAWWVDVIGRLAAGTWPGPGPITVVLTADGEHPWQGHARQFARLQDGGFELER
jgi:ABC-type transporter Mla maintaining outer membrane lipid asymmetry ATPase subunit MlaF